jgi:PKD domain
MRRALLLGVVLAGVTVVPAQAAQPLLLDTWDYSMQSTKIRGHNGHFEGTWNFERPNIVRQAIPGYGLSKRLPLRPRRGWLVARFSEAKKCLRIGGGKQNIYRYKLVLRLRPTKLRDMDGEMHATAAKLDRFSVTKPCIGGRIAGRFLGRLKRQVGPESGAAEIGYNTGPACDEALVELSAHEDDTFLDWDLPVFSYAWTFSDGAGSTAREPKHRFPGPGNHSASVLMRSINGAVAKGSTTVEVPQPDPDC